jgi:VanZ family protein
MSLTVLSFFVQSSLSRNASSEESKAVAGFLSSFITYDTTIGRFVIGNISKIGHCLEYGIFGIESAVYLFCFVDRDKRYAACFRFIGLAMLVAFLDETVQIFSGRGPSVSDVWLDSAGFVTVGAVFSLLIYAFKHLIKPSKDKNNG